MSDRELIRVAVVDDHPVYRQGLSGAFSAEHDLDVVAEVEGVEALAPDVTVDVAVLDLGLTGLSGPAAIECLTGKGMAVLVVSASGERAQVLDAVAAGASGYLTKSAEPAEIVGAVRMVAQGDSYVSPTLAAYLIDADRTVPEEHFRLTAREREVLSLVAAGERDIDIAEALAISVRTVQSHLDRIRNKTGHRRRSDLTRLALAESLVPPGR